jgi:YebC/PmpR family DNA-binding regulatory protein
MRRTEVVRRAGGLGVSPAILTGVMEIFMSGHSKWSTIKRKKGAADAKRGKVFSRLAKEISVAAKAGGGDPAGNPRLRTVLLAARAENMPNENVERAIKRGTGELPGVSYEEIRYEGYAAGGVAIIIDCLTDNKNRTVAEIRHLLGKYGGSMAESGAVTWNFENKGTIAISKSGLTDDDIFEKAIEAGAEDVDTEGDMYEVTTAPQDLHAVSAALQEMGLKIEEAQLTMLPKNVMKVEGKTAESVLRLMEAIEEQDDVQNAYANFDISEEQMAAAMGE